MTTIAVRKTVSQITLWLSVIGLALAVIWVGVGMSSSVATVRPFAVVPRAPYMVAPTPLQDDLRGVSPITTLTVAHPAAVPIRCIIVNGTAVSLRQNGRLVARRFMPKGRELTLHELTVLVNEPEWMRETAQGHFVLGAALVVEKRHFVASSPKTRTVDLLSRPGVFLDITERATAAFEGVTVRSIGGPRRWAGALAPRPFVLFDGAVMVTVSRCTFVNLGWDWTHSYGVSWFDGAHGTFTNSVVRGNFIGLYTQRTHGLTISNNLVTSSRLYGIDPHTFSSSIVIRNNVVMGNAAHGIVLARHVTHSVVEGNRVEGNGESGIVLYDHSSRNIVTTNRVFGNRGDGLEFLIHSTLNVVTGNVLLSNQIAVNAVQSVQQAAVRQNIVDHNQRAVQGIALDTEANHIGSGQEGFRVVPPAGWSWLLSKVLGPLWGVAVVVTVFVRRRILRRLSSKRTGNPRMTYRELLVAAERNEELRHPIGPVRFVPFSGPAHDTHDESD